MGKRAAEMVGGFVFSRPGALLGVLACSAAVGLAIPTTAAAKVTSLTRCQPITVPGKYRLDADVSFGAPVCFSISASNVTLNLNGHTITGTVGSGFGVKVTGSGVKIVGPGTLTGAWHHGIDLGSGDTVRGVTVTADSGDGIDILGSGNDVRGNVTTDNADFGIGVASGATGNTIVGNFAHGNATDLFDENTNCDDNVWKGNDFGTAFPSSCIH